MQIRAKSKWLPYVAAAVATALACLVGPLLIPLLGDNVLWFVFFAAVTFSAWYGGFGPAVFATTLTYLVANLLFIRPDRAFSINIVTFTYWFVCLALAGFSEAMGRALRRAEASAEQIVSIVESITDGFIAVDSRWRCTYMNRAAEEFHRFSGQQWAGKTLWDVFPLCRGRLPESKLREAVDQRTTIDFETFYERSGRWFEVKASPAEADGLAIHFRDITERKQAQIALAQSEERLRLAQQGANAGLWDWDLVTGQVTWSAEYFEIFGLDHATTPSFDNFLGRVHPDDRVHVDNAFSEAVRTRAPLDIQYRTIHSRKGVRWIAGLGQTTLDSLGQPLRMSGIALDITDRKRAEENLRFFSEAGTALFALVDLESTMQKIARLAVPFFADWCVVDILSPLGEVERIAFAHCDTAKERTLKELLDRSSVGWSSSALSRRVLLSGKAECMSDVAPGFIDTVTGDEEHRRLFAELNPVSFVVVPLVVRETTIGTISFVSSESKRRYSTADLELASELARRAAVAIDNARLYRELKEAQRQKDDFLAMLAHELRNPLAAILYANEILKTGGDSPHTAGEIIDRQLVSLTHLIDDLLDVSRITQDKIQLKKQAIDGDQVVRRAIATAQPLVEGRGHQLNVEISDEPMPLHVDPVRVEQILVNLLTNAAKYTPDGGRISVQMFPQDDHAIFKVQDTGIGIPPEMLPRIFELFTQVDQSLDRSQGGLGIGLTVARKLVEMHGGRISVKSDGVGCGSEFTVGLPLAHEVSAAASTEADPQAAVSSQKVLVVDDNVDTAESISNLLERKGYTAAVAHDGHAALRVARTFVPDVVLLDLGLPGLDGYRVAQSLRSEIELANVRLIALSGYGQPADRKRSQEAGFNDHLVKPVAFQKLLAILSNDR